MDEAERKKYPSLPPDYVSLAQLQERWLQKQQENRLKEKQQHELLQETRNRENENQDRREVNHHGLAKMGGHSIRKLTRERVEKDGREMGAVEEKEKREEEPRIGGFGNGVENKNKEKKKTSRRKKKYGAGDETGNGAALYGFGGDMEKNGFKGVGTVPRAEVKVGISGGLSRESSDREGIGSTFQGNEEIVSTHTVEVLPKDGVGDENPEVLNARNVTRGFRGDGSESQECRVKMHERMDKKVELALKKKIEDGVLEIYGKGNYNKWRARRTNHDDRETDYKLKERRAEKCGLKYSVVELNSERKAENEISEVGSKRNVVRGRDKNGFDKYDRRNEIKEHRVGGEGLNDNRVTLEKNLEENAKNGEKAGVGNGFRRYEYWRGNMGRKIGNFTFNNWNGNMRSRMQMNVGGNKRYASYRRFEDGWKVKQRDSGMVWVKKEEKSRDNSAEVGSSGQE